MKLFYLLVFSLSSLFAACKKEKPAIEQLPPVTQTGANTFGCLINGKAWIPKGFIQYTPNFSIVADPTFEKGSFSLRTAGLDRKKDERLSITINSDSIRSEGIYELSDYSNARVQLSKGTASLSEVFCNVNYHGIYHRKGFLKITKYDMQKGIVSGEFEFSLVNKDCRVGDTIKVTNGRFDYKL